MKMKGTKLLVVVVVMALMSAALLMTNSGFKLIARTKSPAESKLLTAAESELSAGWTTTPGPSGRNLKGKMFTLSSTGEGIRFYSPTFSDTTPNPWSTGTPYKTSRGTTRSYSTASESYRTTSESYSTASESYSTASESYRTTSESYSTASESYRTTSESYRTTSESYRTTSESYSTASESYSTNSPVTSTTSHWTTVPPFSGVSVCLRYLGIPQRELFTLSPSRNPLRLGVYSLTTYQLSLQTYYNVIYMTPSIRLWRNIDPEMWTRVCLTVDNMRNVVQLFSGSNMSIRTILPGRYVWLGEPVVEIPGFNGQVTDIQVWDYPLRYKEVFNYMTNGVYASYRGSVLTWSSISYSLRGNALLEDVYEKQASQPISSQGRGRGRRPKGERKTKVVFKERESRERNKEWFK